MSTKIFIYIHLQKENISGSKVFIVQRSKANIGKKMCIIYYCSRFVLGNISFLCDEVAMSSLCIVLNLELNYHDRRLFSFCQITGGAGFVGSHLVDKLMLQGHEVTVADNFFTGRKRNIEHWLGHENFEMLNHDIVNPLYIEGETHAEVATEYSSCCVIEPVVVTCPRHRYVFCRRNL